MGLRARCLWGVGKRHEMAKVRSVLRGGKVAQRTPLAISRGWSILYSAEERKNQGSKTPDRRGGRKGGKNMRQTTNEMSLLTIAGACLGGWGPKQKIVVCQREKEGGEESGVGIKEKRRCFRQVERKIKWRVGDVRSNGTGATHDPSISFSVGELRKRRVL